METTKTRCCKPQLAAALLLWLLLLPLPAQAQQALLTGRVWADDAEAVPYATLRLKGTKWRATANERGLYRLSAAPGK